MPRMYQDVEFINTEVEIKEAKEEGPMCTQNECARTKRLKHEKRKNSN